MYAVGGKRGRRRSCVLYFNGVVEKPACPLGAERGGACGVWDSRQRRHIHTDTGSLERKERQTAGELHLSTQETILNSWTTTFFVCVCLWKTSERDLYGFIRELRDVCVGAAVAICCLQCAQVCGLVCLGWKSGAGTTNSSALSFTPWGVARVTPRRRRQTARLFSLLTSAVKNCKLSSFSY